MKKTAVQNLIDYLEETYVFNGQGQTKKEFKKALKEEHDQTENAFDAGYEERYQQEVNSEKPFFQNGRDYVNKTFKND